MIDGVQLKQLTTHADEHGFFREVLRSTDEIFAEGFGQWSHSVKYTGEIKAFHIHQKQVDWWYVPIGVMKAVVCDLRNEYGSITLPSRKPNSPQGKYDTYEYLLGENQPCQVLKIPPGVAHGFKVLQGPAHLFYITSKVYNPEDEGRIPYDALGYDWHKVEIK